MVNIARSLTFLQGLKSWKARAGFVLSRCASLLRLPNAIPRYFSSWVHGPYVGSIGRYELRPGTIDAWTVHPLHEAETHKMLRELICSPGGVLIDVGGFCGSFSLRYRDLFDHIFVFEPFPENSDAIVRNIELNNAADKITLIRAAAAARSGLRRLYLGSNDTHSLANTDRTRSLQIEACTLDEALGERLPKLTVIRAIKVDVEGAEVDVLKGAERILSTARPLVVAEANTKVDERRLTEYLASNGYRAWAQTDCRNFWYIPDPTSCHPACDAPGTVPHSGP